MKKLISFFSLVLFLMGCQKNEVVSEFTGNETNYALSQASNYSISGVVTLKERKDGTTTVAVELEGTQGEAEFPVHLHLGDVSTPKADIAAILNPVAAAQGKSETVLSKLADESSVNYQQLISLKACIKIHLSDTGAERDIVLAGGNIGKSATSASSTGRVGFAECKSE
jgi:hypothetical protein